MSNLDPWALVRTRKLHIFLYLAPTYAHRYIKDIKLYFYDFLSIEYVYFKLAPNVALYTKGSFFVGIRHNMAIELYCKIAFIG